MEKKVNSYDYLNESMTGWEAYRALELVLKRWYDISKEPYIEWLMASLQSDPALIGDFAEAVRDMLIEREKFGNENLVNRLDKLPVYKPCKCQKQ